MIQDPEPMLTYYYKGGAKIVILPKNFLEFKNYLKNNMDFQHEIWIVSSPHNGVDSDIKTWLDSNCNLERKGLIEWSGNTNSTGQGNIYCNCNRSSFIFG